MTDSLRLRRVGALVLSLAVAGWVAPVQAATITVDTTGDVGTPSTCTLRDAITAANTDTLTNGCAAGDGVDDNIVFGVTGTITLGSALPEITASVNIVGPGPGDLVITGGAFGAVVKITGTGVAISGLTLTGGASSGLGGGLYVPSSGEAELTNIAITNNTAHDGGGVASGGNLLLTDCIVSNNTANGGTYGGGGIYNSGTLTLANTTISNNDTNNAGGGIYQHSAGTSTLTGITVTNNSSTRGGGLYVDRDVTLADSVVSNNTAGARGGGVFATGNVNITGSTVSGNSSSFMGGGIDAAGDVTITESTVSGNTGGVSSGSGGGIYSGGTVALTDSTLSLNVVAEFGGGINASTVTLTRSTVSGNSSGTAGGGIYSNSATLDNSTLSGNSSAWGGAVYQGGSSTLSATSSTISGNSATTEGGGVWTAGTATLRNSIVAGNTAQNCQHPSGSGTFSSQGYNISNDASCNLSATGDQPSTNPMIGPLADNGGPTKTHMLLAGSPAIDAGDDNNCPATDQRGITRPQDGNDDGAAACDIGAVERLPNDLLITDLSTDADPVTVGQQSMISVKARNAGGDAVNDVELTINLPAELGFISATSGCSEAGAATVTTVTVTASADTAGSATISTNVTGTVVEANTNNNAAQTTLTINAASVSGGGGGGGSGGGLLNPLALVALAPFWYARRRRSKVKYGDRSI